MWFDELPGKAWTGIWNDYVLCHRDCLGIRKIETPCPACGGGPLDISPTTMIVGGREMTLHATLMGAEGRYEDYIYLQMLQREWERPVVEFEGLSYAADTERPSSRAALVLLFWGYFETRIGRLHRAAMRKLPPRVLENQLRRYSSIGQRLHELYRIFFDTNYFDDLRTQGYSGVADLLEDIHERRNQFTHGKPQAINDATVNALVENLKAEHEAWIAVYNSRLKTM